MRPSRPISAAYKLIIGDSTAELVKITIGSAMKLDEPLTHGGARARPGRRLPRIVSVNSTEVSEALSEPLERIAENVKTVLEHTPPELASDIIDRGMVMTGGSSLLRNFDRFLTKETGIPCHVAENPMLCTALGAARGLERLPILRRSLQTMDSQRDKEH